MGTHVHTAEPLSGAALDNLSINTVRFLSVDAVQHANSGHPGLPLGAAPMAYVVWTRFLKHNPKNPTWFDRDRFVLSAGHGSMLLYSLLHLTGYDLSLEEIRGFRQWGSRTPGHPERGITPGVETTTGPLGQGFGNAIGMAMAEAFLAARYNRPGHTIIDHYTFAMLSDGDLMEGVASEAASLAGHLRLGKLICLYDDNHVSLSAGTGLTFTEDVALRFQAYGWHTRRVDDGNDVTAIANALEGALEATDSPKLILVRTHLGYGSPHKQDTFAAHGAPLGQEEVRLTKQHLGWPEDGPFHIPEPVLQHFRQAVERGEREESAWNGKLPAYRRAYPDAARELERVMAEHLPPGWESAVPAFAADAKGLATRAAAGQVLADLAGRIPQLIGGSADLDPSTHTALRGLGDFESADAAAETQGAAGGGWSFAGRNLHFGVREHAMGAILNGLAAHGGLLPFGATFLIFSDYMRPPIRLAALMGLHVIYLFTHDSIGLGEDGPTHQPVEQLANLRAIPNLVVIRPADANETATAWRVALRLKNRPVALVLTRQRVPTLDRRFRFAADGGLERGAYILEDDASGTPDLILIASGSEVPLIVAARDELTKQNLRVRLVSMPSWELFDAQPRQYRDTVLPPAVRVRLAVEAGATQGWCRYVGDAGDVLGIDRFGASAPGEVVMREYGFSADEVCRRALTLLHRQ
jgi:transketolase